MKNNAKKIKVIIADDHPVFRIGLEIVIKGFHIIGKIVLANNGEEVIRLLKQESFDIVFMGIVMKPMDGMQATEIVTKQFPLTKVIVFSMKDDRKTISEIID